MTDKECAELLQMISQIYMKLEKMPPTPEIGQVTLKLTEAGMWCRMAADMSKTPAPMEVKIEKRQNRFYDTQRNEKN